MWCFIPIFLVIQALVSPTQGQTNTSEILPSKIGYVLFPGFELFDVYAPLSAFTHLSFRRNMNLTIIADSLEPITQKSPNATANAIANSTFGVYFLPTHTFEQAKNLDLDVLVVPGGGGTRAPDPALLTAIDFVRETYPKVKYLITICTGAGIAARAGVLDGKYATTNKRAWAQTTALGPKVNWVAVARWTQDGNIWTSSGVSSGVDAVIAWMASVYGDSVAQGIADGLEYVRRLVSTDDPFAGLYGLTSANNTFPSNATVPK